MANEIDLYQATSAPTASPNKSGAIAAVVEHASHFDRLARASEVARRLELCALIAERCGWQRPHHSTGENARDVIAVMYRDRRRASRLLRGLETLADQRREALRLNAEGELDDLGRRLRAILQPSGVDLIAQELRAMIAAAPNCPASGEIYIPSTIAALDRARPSIGALILGLNDCGKADARRYGRAPVAEIEEALGDAAKQLNRFGPRDSLRLRTDLSMRHD